MDSTSNVPLWLSMSYMLPDLIAQPFSIFGTLAIAESQMPERVLEQSEKSSSRTNERSRSRSRPRKMATADLSSVLSLYRQLPRSTSRILKASLVNLVADRLVTWPCSWLARRLLQRNFAHRHPVRSFVVAGLFEALATLWAAPVRLLATELIVFKRFDWRFLQLNTKIMPIFLPNLTNAAISFLLYQLSDSFLEKFNDLLEGLAENPSIATSKLGKALGLVLLSTVFLLGCEALVEVWRVKADLLVLNGDSTVIEVDDSYNGDVREIASTKDYSVKNALKRYAAVYGLPVAFAYLVAGFSAPIIGQFRERNTSAGDL